jgi:hypothetical protein
LQVPNVDVEWLALCAGLKPAIRLSGPPDVADGMEQRYRGLGAHTARARGPIGLTFHVQDVVYVARTQADADAVCDAELPLLADASPKPKSVEIAALTSVGARLGYPPCCIAAFAGRIERAPSPRRPGHPCEDFLATREAWVPAARTRINNLLLAQRVRWITFEPCRYDCPRALAFADGVATALGRRDPGAVAQLDAALRCTLAVAARDAGRALVQLEGGTVARAAAPVRPHDRTRHPPDAALAESLVGLSVAADGSLVLPDGSAVVVVEFRGGASA